MHGVELCLEGAVGRVPPESENSFNLNQTSPLPSKFVTNKTAKARPIFSAKVLKTISIVPCSHGSSIRIVLKLVSKLRSEGPHRPISIRITLRAMQINLNYLEVCVEGAI